MRRLVVVALALAALGAGCFKGGFLNAGEQDKPSGEKARFIARVDALCQDANDRITGLGPPSLAALKAAVTVRYELLAAIEPLVPPRGGVDQIKYDAFVGAMRNLTTGLEGIAIAAEIGDRAGADKLGADVQLAARQVDESAAEYQFQACRTVQGTELASAR